MGTSVSTMRLFTLPGGLAQHPEVQRWMREHRGALGALAQHWFEVIRRCGSDVRELLHDGHPTACVNDAAFAYVNVFSAHVNVGFFCGAVLHDPARLLQGSGKFMRHVTIRPGVAIDEPALTALIATAYADIQQRSAAGP